MYSSIVGWSGSVWASDAVRLWHENTVTFQIESSNTSTCTYTKEFSSCCVILHDYAFLYQDMTDCEDIEKLTSTDFSKEIMDTFLKYEKEQIDVFLLKLEEILDKVANDKIQFQHDKLVLFESRLKPVLEKTLKLAYSRLEMKNTELVHVCVELKSKSSDLLDILDELNLPKVKPRIAYLTDAGPAVGVSNFEVCFRDAELARLWNSDYRVRVHRSRGDSGQGEAERTNSAIADSIVDGATIEWKTLKQYEGVTEEEITEMSLKDFEAHENERMTKNAWMVAEELVKRIDGAYVLGEYIHCQLSEEPSKMFFFNRDSLQAYQNASMEKKKPVPCSGYINKMMQFMSSHYIYGGLFMEYVKFSCSNSTENASLCEFCSNSNWIGPPSDRIPQPVPDSEFQRFL